MELALKILLLITLHLQLLWLAESNDFCETGEWISHGGDLANRRFAEDELRINPATAPGISQRWRYVIGSDVSATPAVSDCVVYVPSWNGLVVAVTIHDGTTVWRVNLTEVTGISGVLSRTTPTITRELVLLGLLGPARVVALQRSSGKLVWISEELDETPLSRITMSGTAYKGAFYVGISSIQELVELCCTFQGSFQKLDLKTGKRIWRTYMVPENTNFTGVAVWGSSPSIDSKLGLVFIATGNLYTVPEEVQSCLDQNANSSDVHCFPQTGLCDDAVVAVDMKSGAIRWCNRLGGNDVWRFPCVQPNPPPNCPPTPGPDYDFGEAPMLLTVPRNCSFLDIVVTGQKSGIVWAFERTEGKLIWQTVAGPGGEGGGATWGSATDNHQIYTNIANSNRLPFVLTPSTEVTTGGGWVAMDAATGKIRWSTANPTGERAFGPVSVTKSGVVMVGSFDEEGHVLALNAKDGEIMWEGTTGSTVYGGFSIAHGCGFCGSGYAVAPLGPAFGGTRGDSLFAFCV